MTKPRKTNLNFRTEAEERAFWESAESTSHVDWAKAERVRFPNLSPSTKSISLRLPVDLLERVKIAANKRDVPYQSLIKVWLAEKIASESNMLSNLFTIENLAQNNASTKSAISRRKHRAARRASDKKLIEHKSSKV